MADRKLPNPGDCELIFHAALRAGDAMGVKAALIALAAQDPHRAERMYELLQMALLVGGVGRGPSDSDSSPEHTS